MFKLKKGSSLVPSLWCCAILAAILFFVPFTDSLTPALLWGTLSIALSAFLWLHNSTVRIEVKPREIFISRGFLFIQQKRIPLRFVTSFFCLQTPLQRFLKQCVIIICTSGSFSIFIGFSKDDAAILYEQILGIGGNV